ncbi:hypothetical protein M407DRAFT_32064 [Tulasnella calospora MUT 4182]|uniref:Uncharacterized protein n=1 Tax=Tulasnella calospora MUT 4182 TaxID=1051891 RepID=A0A0C3Q5G5_9AGAM|nr:hypothetical protein M407DRAFT_32064 [Tulasnella calospora MUT 4182]
MTSVNELPSLWQQQDVGEGLKYTSDLLNTIVPLATKSPNHSLKAQHLLSRGIEVLASIQQFLATGTDDFLAAIRTIQSLEVTETVLIESITVLKEDAENPVPSDRAVLSSWHLNRNTFSNQLKTLSDAGPKKPDTAWTGVMRDVVRADDLNWATRLVEDMTTLDDEQTKESLGTILSTLEEPETSTQEEAENIQTDSILAIMCLADEVARPSARGRGQVLNVLNDMAGELKKKEGRNWKSLSDRLHDLPVCRQVEKPLLVHQGDYSIPDIVHDAQVEVDQAGAAIAGDLDADVEATKKQLSQVERSIKDAAGHLKALASKKNHNSIKGGKENSSISYAASRLLTNTALAITPACEIMALNEPLQAIVSAVHGFIDALDVFDLGPSWKGAFTRALGGTASLLTQFGRSNINIASPVEATFTQFGRADTNMTSPVGDSFPEQTRRSSISESEGTRTPPERAGTKSEKHGAREKVADFASNVKDKFLGGK